MPRTPASLDDIVKDAVEGVVKRTSLAIARTISDLVAARLEEELRKNVGAPGKGRAGRGRGRTARPRAELTRWAADRRARRVPNFVIELTGLKTKKQIVAKYGDGVVFEKGKPAPKPK